LAIVLLIANVMRKNDICRFGIRSEKKIKRSMKKSFYSNLWKENTNAE